MTSIRTLNASALAALQDFYHERDERQKKFSDLQKAAEDDFGQESSKEFSMEMFSEDWNASQFWYTDDTSVTLAQQLLENATSETRIAVVSAPSVYVQLKNLVQKITDPSKTPRITLFEFDDRFAIFKKDFVHYDLHQPLKLDSALKGQFDRIICDPPFLNEDCQTKTALTARWLARTWSSEIKVIVCTGERMADIIHRVYGKIGIQTTTFLPQHSKGLSNEFKCYSNFICNDWAFAVESSDN